MLHSHESFLTAALLSHISKMETIKSTETGGMMKSTQIKYTERLYMDLKKHSAHFVDTNPATVGTPLTA